MNDVIAGGVIVALSAGTLLLWAVTEGLLTRRQRRLEDRDALARSVGVLRSDYLAPWRDRRPGHLPVFDDELDERDGGAA